MLIRFGYDISVGCAQPTHFLTRMAVRPERRADFVDAEDIRLTPDVPFETFEDSFGNICLRFTAPAGETRIRCTGLIHDHGEAEPVVPHAGETPIEQLPADVLQYLLPSRYCESDSLAPFAWDRFGHLPQGWARVQAICDFANGQIKFDYQKASATRTAQGAITDGYGVCRDFAHTAVALCRAMSIPARYVNGYLGDIGVPYGGPMDFSAWFEAYLDGQWYAFDARHNTPRIGRINIAVGRDAADVAMLHSFGPHDLHDFLIVCEDAENPATPPAGSTAPSPHAAPPSQA
ncbi:transglutaminase-like domain-containing protein [Falsirhodobacter halotolerans]|uniref:transglutaminase-like domain-containing protein n=1 Tax=Falsirhodobacter halotolerans TaxID=1146892 RepID=UPI001FD3E43D|nr:transglutaminase family protein [Falsirhodobacter halotolerans]MCJ8140421.1 transglutaminase family protein [Falsirhodobacter halotolerans]